MDISRTAAAGSLSLTGVVLFGIVSTRVPSVSGHLTGLVAAGFGVVVALAFLAGGIAVYRSALRTTHVARVAGWNLLGVVVTVLVLALVGVYQQSAGGVVRDPLFSAAVVVGLSAVAHVLIGLNDVRRIRTRELARQHQKSSVINRLVRHNLRHTAQLLVGWGDRLLTTEEPAERAAIGSKLKTTGDDLAAVYDQVETVSKLVEERDAAREDVDVRQQLRHVVAELSEAYPDATISVRGDDDVAVVAGPTLETAFGEVVENALEHGGEDPTVDVGVEQAGDRVVVRVTDDGPGIPEAQRELVDESADETSLSHANGLGLWLSKWIVEAYGGTLRLPKPEGSGAVVEFRLNAA